MIISESVVPSIYLHQSMGSNAIITDRIPTSGFSAMLSRAITNQDVLIQEEVASQNLSDTSCDDVEAKKCKCESDDKEAEEAKTEKTGFAACIDCQCRKADECALWNGKEGMFDLLAALSQNPSKNTTISLPHNQSYSQTDFVLATQALFDYTNAYAYAGAFVNRKILEI